MYNKISKAFAIMHERCVIRYYDFVMCAYCISFYKEMHLIVVNSAIYKYTCNAKIFLQQKILITFVNVKK